MKEISEQCDTRYQFNSPITETLRPEALEEAKPQAGAQGKGKGSLAGITMRKPIVPQGESIASTRGQRGFGSGWDPKSPAACMRFRCSRSSVYGSNKKKTAQDIKSFRQIHLALCNGQLTHGQAERQTNEHAHVGMYKHVHTHTNRLATSLLSRKGPCP